MDAITIHQSSSNWRNAVSVFAALGLTGVAAAGMASDWPPHACFEWFLLPILFIGGLAMTGGYLHQVLRPRDHRITISTTVIEIEDSTYGKWRRREIDPAEVAEFVSSEGGCMILMKSRKAHDLGPNLTIRDKEIGEALSRLHPHIKVSFR